MNKFKCCIKNSVQEENINRTYNFLRVISDLNRLKIFCVLQENSKCVCEIVSATEMSDKLASHHLKQLKGIGLLNESREGNYIRYSLNRKAIREYKKFFNKVIK